MYNERQPAIPHVEDHEALYLSKLDRIRSSVASLTSALSLDLSSTSPPLTISRKLGIKRVVRALGGRILYFTLHSLLIVYFALWIEGTFGRLLLGCMR